jgi:hypothetical protein
MKRPGVALAVAAGLFVLMVVGGFLWGQTRVIERPPRPDEAEAMITKADLLGSGEGGTAERFVRVFPSMPMLWLNFRQGGAGEVQVRSHLLRYDDEELARTGVERFAEGDGRWLDGCATEPWPLPDSVDAGTLHVGDDCLLLTARRGGSYVHLSVKGWVPADAAALHQAIAPSLEALDALPWPPK